MSAITKILDRLDGVRQTKPGRWIAKCPAHPDRSPSLSIKEENDGRILLLDFGGCPTQIVLQAIGLDFRDLYDAPLAHHLPPIRGGFTARELLELTAHEATVAALLARDAQSRQLTVEEITRLEKAADRLTKAQALVHGR
jgi:hypothetical protein